MRCHLLPPNIDAWETAAVDILLEHLDSPGTGDQRLASIREGNRESSERKIQSWTDLRKTS